MGGATALIGGGAWCVGLLFLAEERTVPPPRVAVGGFPAIECSSTVMYARAPGVPHRLDATYAFPDRARWWLGLGDESSPERLMRLRYGDAVYAIDPGKAVSRELLAEERSEALVQLEMRKALLLWPLGFEWHREDDVSRARLPRLGTLSATFQSHADQRPTAIRFTSEAGAPLDEFRAITWRVEGGKAWPTGLELWHGDERVWTESIRSVDTKTRFIDSYFVPPDVRDLGASRPAAGVQVRGIDLPECRVERVPKEGLTLSGAVAEWKQLVAERSRELAEHGLALEDKLTLEIGRDARPTALLLRLAPTKAVLPDSIARRFQLVRERPGLTTIVIGLAGVDAPHVEALTAAVPRDAQAQTPYLRLDPRKPDEHVLIVLPLAAQETGGK